MSNPKTVLLELRTKIMASAQEIENRITAIETNKLLPIRNEELRNRVKAISHVLYCLQSTVYRNRDPAEGPAAFNYEETILNADLQTLLDRRESERDPEKAEFAGQSMAFSMPAEEDEPEIVVQQDPAVLAASLASKLTDLDEAISSPAITEESARRVAGESLTVLSDVVQRLGFTEQVQIVAKKTSQVTIKLLGKTPNLSNILEKMKVDDGKYVTSHSLMLAEIAGGLACRVGWNSPATYLKLIMASFLHDLPFRNDKLAEVKELPKTAGIRFTAKDIEEIRLHPIKAAQYVSQFRELPADIDTIIIQHHEQPDGRGFPIGLTHSQIHPLSALFIIAHDLLDFQLANPTEATLVKFQEAHADKYTQGQFKKLFFAMATGVPVQL